MRGATAVLASVSTVVLSAAVLAADHQVIYVVRHAERAASTPQPALPPNAPGGHGMMIADDPPLSPAGQARAARLATMLGSADIKRIYTTEFKRTRQTGAPLADKLRITPVMAAAKDPAPLVKQLQQGTGNALVVGHSDTIPDLLKKLGVKDTVTIADDQYDDLFIVIRRVGEPSTLIRLKY